jgi:Rieske 2Fe-2S family protein
MTKPTRSSDGAKTLEQKYYVCQDIYDLETENIFNQQWIYIGRCDSLPEEGDYFLHEQNTESLIVLRNVENKIVALHNCCTHRGTKLITETKGKLKKHITCLYHAWSFAQDGSLVSAPHMNECEGFNKSNHSLASAHIKTFEGFIFLNLSDKPADFDEQFATLTRYGDYKMSELKTVHSITYEAECNWKLVVQNYSECYHCPSLHPQLNRLTAFRDTDNDEETGPILGGPMQLGEKFTSMTTSGQRCCDPIGNVSGDDLKQVHYYVVMPNMLLSLHPDYVLVHQIQRISTTRTRVICDWLFHPTNIKSGNYDPKGAIEFWNLTNSQDWLISERSQLGISSRAYKQGPYAELESMLAQLDIEYKKMLGKTT